MTTVKDFVYTGKYSHDRGYDKSRCAFTVHERGRGVYTYQCQKNIKEYVDGIGFCGIHAKEVKRRLGKLDGGIVRFATGLPYGQPVLARIVVVEETNKTIYVQDVEELMGHTFALSSGLQRKDNPYLKEYKFFDDKPSALKHLEKIARERVDDLSKDFEEASAVYEKIHGLLIRVSESR